MTYKERQKEMREIRTLEKLFEYAKKNDLWIRPTDVIYYDGGPISSDDIEFTDNNIVMDGEIIENVSEIDIEVGGEYSLCIVASAEGMDYIINCNYSI